MKRMLSLLLCAALILIFTGCGLMQTPETTAPAVPPETVPSEVPYVAETIPLKYPNVELYFVAPLEETDPQVSVYQQAASVFEAQTGARVHLNFTTEADLAEMLVLGENVDIFQTKHEYLVESDVHFALDLTQMAQKAGYDARSYETLRTAVTESCGFLAAIPQIPHLGGVYYNRAVFSVCGIEQMPRTWTEFMELCLKLEEAGWVALALDIEDTLIASELHLERSLGAERLAVPEAQAKWAKDEALIVAAQQIIDFVMGGHMAPGTPVASPGGQNRVAMSNVAMMVGTEADCAAVERDSTMDLEWGYFPWPGDGVGSGCFGTFDVLAVHSETQQAQAAFDFICLLTGGEFDQLRADVTCGIPADPSNISPITGATETVASTQLHRSGLLNQERSLLFQRLWSGYYEKAHLFAGRWDYEIKSS